MKSRIAFAVMLLLSGGASAEVVVSEKVLQNGWFSSDGSYYGKGSPEDPYCAAHIRYPVISGMMDAVQQERINAFFKGKAEESQCGGVQMKSKPKEYVSADYEDRKFEVLLQTPELLSIFIVRDYGGAGAAHPQKDIESYIITLKTGARLKPGKIFGENIPKVNKYILDELNKRPYSTPGSLGGVVMQHDVCNQCHLVLEPKGIKLLFEVGSVGSMADGNVEFIIPKKFITSPEILQALGGS